MSLGKGSAWGRIDGPCLLIGTGSGLRLTDQATHNPSDWPAYQLKHRNINYFCETTWVMQFPVTISIVVSELSGLTAIYPGFSDEFGDARLTR